EASDKCLQKCITSPGTALTGGEKQCLQRCMERYIETWETVQRTLMQRLQSEMGSNSSSSMLGTDFNTTSFS
uniref:Mitochondrial import inner membrane translocase subunit n=1 Tax=Acrobeloides nanus TaxID=290746 RepID=A0A914CXJ5_9BILA